MSIPQKPVNKMLIIRILTTLLVAILTVLALATASTPTHAVMLVSRSQEIAIGRQVYQQTVSEYGLSKDTQAIERVNKIGARIAAASPRKDVTYTYTVLDSKIINAFAAPGGPVMITENLVNMLNDDELAFVLAHETGHIAGQHGRKAINQALIAQGLFSILFGRSSDLVAAGINIMYTLYERGYSRDQEYQADSYGVQIMRNANYNPEGAIGALAKLGTERARGINRYFATHPDVPDRIDRVAAMAGITEERKQILIRQAQAEMSR
jgi:predicted Zn-dependent protease